MTRAFRLSKLSDRRNFPAPAENPRAASHWAETRDRPLPELYAVIDRDGAAICYTPDPHVAWRVLCDDDRAVAKVDAADHSRIFAVTRRT